MHTYIALKNKQTYRNESFQIVPIRLEDRHAIRNWRNEQIYHLRQTKELTVEEQNNYFKQVISKLFEEQNPEQILFSFLQDEICIGYGGLVHINWIDKHAEISFLMDTDREKESFGLLWGNFLELIQQVAFLNLGLHKVFTYAFDVRPHLYPILEEGGLHLEAVLNDHCYFDGTFKNVHIHSRISSDYVRIRKSTNEDARLLFEWANDKNVRENSFSSEPIQWDAHIEWLKRTFAAGSKLFILELGDRPAGMIRFDKKDNYYLLNYSIASRFRGLGLGKKIITFGIEALKAIQSDSTINIHAQVKEQNVASLHIFRTLGFEELFLEEQHTFQFTKSL